MMKSRVRATICAVAAALVLPGCTAETSEAGADSAAAAAAAEAPAAEASRVDTSLGGAWVLVSFGPAAGLGEAEAGIDATLAARADDRPVTLDLSESGRVAGHSGCNNYFSEFGVDSGHTIRIGPIGSTRKACEDEAMALEQAFLRSLEAATMIFAGTDELEIHGEDGVLMAFRPQEPAE